VDHSYDDGEPVVQQFHRRVGQTDALKEGIDDAVVLQQHSPREVLHEDSGPEGQQYNSEENNPHDVAGVAEHDGNDVAQGHGDHSGCEADGQRVHQRTHDQRILQHPLVGIVSEA
jgi:hypothetical protein